VFFVVAMYVQCVVGLCMMCRISGQWCSVHGASVLIRMDAQKFYRFTQNRRRVEMEHVSRLSTLVHCAF
jgi:hypothetical protein